MVTAAILIRLPSSNAWRALLCLLPVLLFAACAQTTATTGAGNYAGQSVAPSQYYPPPGPPEDPWGPYIEQAATRYQIPAQWIRAVMAQESAGEEQAVSPVGAIGLMQVMPETYAELRDENGLGDDPFNPRDNILAGAAYIKQMYDKYGAPGFLAAYNAGPSALDDYLAGQSPLPDETVNYLSAVTPNLGNTVPFSGPLAQYASNAGGITPTAISFATGCDVNAAYDPDHPCAAAPPPADVVAQAETQPNAGACNADLAYDPDNPCSAAAGTQGSCDTDLAYDPDNPCMSPAQPANAMVASAPPANPVQPASALADAEPESQLPSPTPPQPPASAPAPTAPAPGWAIQVGAFASPGLARAVAEGARAEAPRQLQAAAVALPATTPFGGIVLYQARLTNLTAADAIGACSSLNSHQLPCVVVPAKGA